MELITESRIIPAVIPQSRHHLDAMLSEVARFADRVQVDIVDGVFDDSRSWPYNTVSPLSEVLASVRFDALPVMLDLMIAAPEETLDLWLCTNPAQIVVHVESTKCLSDVLEHAGCRGYQLGLAFNNETDLALLDELDLACVDFIQLMGIREIGEQGNRFDGRVLARVVALKRAHPSMPVYIDGAVDLETLPRLKNAGADHFVVGSAIWKSNDPGKTYTELIALAGRGR